MSYLGYRLANKNLADIGKVFWLWQQTIFKERNQVTALDLIAERQDPVVFFRDYCQ